MSNLGFIGLGTMGGRIARRLLDAGHSTAGYNRTPARAEALVNAGMRLYGSPREVAPNGDVIFSMMTETAAVTNGADGLLAGLSPGKIYVDRSAVSPSLSRHLASRVAAALERVRPILETLGQKIIHVGGNGQAITTKIAINLNLAIQLYSAALSNEMLTVARAMGYADQDFAILFKVLARLSGMEA